MSNLFRNKIIKLILGVLFLGLLIFYISNSNLSLVWEYLIQLKVAFIIMILFTFVAYLMATWAWKLCLPKEDTLPIWKLFILRLVGEAITLINPTNVVAGDASKVYLLKKGGVSKQSSLTSILLSRIVIMLSSFILALISIAYLLVNSNMESMNWLNIATIIFVFIALSLMLIAIMHKELYLYKLIFGILSIVRLKKRFLKMLKNIKKININVARYYLDFPFRFFASLSLSMGHWIMGAMEFLIILYFLGIGIGVLPAIAVEMGVMVFKTLGSVVPGQIGIEEMGNKFMLEIIGIQSAEIWIAVSALRRARQLFWIIMAAIFYWLFKRPLELSIQYE